MKKYSRLLQIKCWNMQLILKKYGVKIKKNKNLMIFLQNLKN